LQERFLSDFTWKQKAKMNIFGIERDRAIHSLHPSGAEVKHQSVILSFIYVKDLSLPFLGTAFPFELRGFAI